MKHERKQPERVGLLWRLAATVLQKRLRAGGWSGVLITAVGDGALFHTPQAMTTDGYLKAVETRYQTALRTAAFFSAALRRYGRHLATCEQLVSPDRPCTCGFSAVMAEGK